MQLNRDKLIIKVPITGATSKIRVKRRVNNFGEPISTSSNNFTNDDYLEWQISYFLPLDTIWDAFRNVEDIESKKAIFKELFYYYKNNELYEKLKSFVEQNQNIKKSDFKNKIREIFEKNNKTIIIKPHKNNKSYVSYELSDMFKAFYKAGIITKKEIESMLEYNTKDNLDIENNYKIKRESTHKIVKENFEFFEEKAPLFIYKIDESSFVEIILQHKQKAVGYQCMIYFGFFVKSAKDLQGRTIIGRTAKPNEEIMLEISKEHLFAIAKSFVVASKDHNWDMKTILKDIIK